MQSGGSRPAARRDRRHRGCRGRQRRAPRAQRRRGGRLAIRPKSSPLIVGRNGLIIDTAAV